MFAVTGRDLVLLAGPGLKWAAAEGRELCRATFHPHTRLLCLAVVQLVFESLASTRGIGWAEGGRFSSGGHLDSLLFTFILSGGKREGVQVFQHAVAPFFALLPSSRSLLLE